jgi:hypothetical protein
VTIAKLSRTETVRFATEVQQVSSTKQLRDDRQASMDRIAEARGKLAGVEDPESERKALEELQQALGQYFDKDMEIRRAELERVRSGLNDMEARLQKRAAAKEGIVQLQLKMIINEADGLGFFSDGDASRVYGGGSMFAPSGAMTAPGATPMNPFYPAVSPRPDRGAPRQAR